MKYDSFALSKIKENPQNWFLFGISFIVLGSIPILNLIVTMNAHRAIIRHLEGKAEVPSINDLINMDHAADFIIGSFLVALAASSGIILCGVGVYASVFLCIFAQYLISDGMFQPVEAIKASFYYAKDNIGNIVSFVLIETILMTVWSVLALFTCGIGFLLLLPLIMIVFCQFYLEHKEGILKSAQRHSVPLLDKK